MKRIFINSMRPQKSDENEPTYTNYVDYDDEFIDETTEPRREKSLVFYDMDTYSNFNYTSHYPQQCRAIYDFQVRRDITKSSIIRAFQNRLGSGGILSIRQYIEFVT